MLATSGAGTSYPLGAPEFTHYFSGERVTRSLVMFCTSLFDIFHLAIVLFDLRFTDSDYPFGIFKLFPNTKREREREMRTAQNEVSNGIFNLFMGAMQKIYSSKKTRI